MLRNLSGCPTCVQDLHPELEVITVKRHHREALITVEDGTICETCSMALDEDVHHP